MKLTVDFEHEEYELDVSCYDYKEEIYWGMPVWEENYFYRVRQNGKVIPKKKITAEMRKAFLNEIRAENGVEIRSL